MKNEPEHIHILLLEDLDEASREVENAILDNIFKGKCHLPSNARVGATSRKPLSSRRELANYFGQLDTDVYSSFQNQCYWNKKPYTNVPYNRLKVYKLHPFFIAFIEDAASKGRNIYAISADGLAFMEDVFLTPHTWEMASHILSLFNNIRLLEPIIGTSLTKEFQKFLEEKYQLNSDYHQSRTF